MFAEVASVEAHVRLLARLRCTFSKDLLTYTGLAVSMVVVPCCSLPLHSLFRLRICKKGQQPSVARDH